MLQRGVLRDCVTQALKEENLSFAGMFFFSALQIPQVHCLSQECVDDFGVYAEHSCNLDLPRFHLENFASHVMMA